MKTDMKIKGGFNSKKLWGRVDDFIDSLPEEMTEMRKVMEGQTTSETLKDILILEISKCERSIKEQDLDKMEDINKAVAELNPHIRAYNDSVRIDRLYQLEQEPFGSAMELYMENQCVTGIAVRWNKDAGSIEWDEDPAVYLRPYDVFRNLNPETSATIEDAAWLFIDNCLKFYAKTEKAEINKPKLSDTFESLRKRWDWKDDSYRGLVRQLSMIYSWIFKDAAPKMEDIRKADVQYLLKGALTVKDIPNAPGTYEACKVTDFINLIFRSAYACKNCLKYEVRHREKEAEKRFPKSVTHNKAMGEAPEKHGAVPKAGPVTVVNPPKQEEEAENAGE